MAGPGKKGRPRKHAPADDSQSGLGDETLIDPQTISIPQDADDADMADFDEILSQEDMNGGLIYVYRRGPSQHYYQLCDWVPPDRWRNGGWEYLLRRHGGGDYIIQPVTQGGKKHRKVRKSLDYRQRGELDGPEHPAQPQLFDIESKIKEAVKGVQGSSDNSQTLLLGMMQMMMESQKQQSTMLVEAMKSMGGNGSGSEKSLIEQIQPVLIEQMKSRGSGNGSIKDMLETLRELQDMTGSNKEDKSKNGDDEMPQWMKMLAPLAGQFIGQAAQFMGAGKSANHSGSRAAQDGQAPSQQPQPESDSKSLDDPQTQFNRYIDQLLVASEKDSDPSIYADLFFDLSSEQDRAGLLPALQSEQWFEGIFGQHPKWDQISKHREWFTEMRDAILERMKEESHDIHRQERTQRGSDPTQSSSGSDEATATGHAGADAAAGDAANVGA